MKTAHGDWLSSAQASRVISQGLKARQMVKHSPGKARQLVVVKVPAAPQPHTHATGGRHQRHAVLGASCAQKTAYQTINSAHKMKTAHGDWLSRYSGQASQVQVFSQGLKVRQMVKHSPGKARQLIFSKGPAIAQPHTHARPIVIISATPCSVRHAPHMRLE